jgi:hypothetical protein
LPQIELKPVIACLRLVELCPMTPPLVAGPALVYGDGSVTIFGSMEDMAEVIMRDALHTIRVPSPLPVPGIVDLPRSLWYQLQAICAEILATTRGPSEQAADEPGAPAT